MATFWDKIYFGLKIVLILSLLLLWIVIKKSTIYECDLCKFEIEGKNIRFDDFMNLYHEKCLKAEMDNLDELFKKKELNYTQFNEIIKK